CQRHSYRNEGLEEQCPACISEPVRLTARTEVCRHGGRKAARREQHDANTDQGRQRAGGDHQAQVRSPNPAFHAGLRLISRRGRVHLVPLSFSAAWMSVSDIPCLSPASSSLSMARTTS